MLNYDFIKFEDVVQHELISVSPIPAIVRYTYAFICSKNITLAVESTNHDNITKKVLE